MTLSLVMPMAGNGNRFKEAGYTEPKPFILVNGKPMFQHAVECIGINFDQLIFIVQKEHNISNRIKEIYPNAIVVELTAPTQGAAETILTAKEYFKNTSIFIANCDQHVEWNSSAIDRIINERGADGAIAIFECPERDPKWSYAKIDGVTVTEVAEKNPISEWATVGFYAWKDGSEFVRAAEEMIANNERVNGEFYLCPVFNYSIKNNKHIVGYTVNKMQGLGTPEDLEQFLSKEV